MKVIIDIPEEDYLRVQNGGLIDCFSAITNGVVLPEDHGKLIDVKQAMEVIAKDVNKKAYFGEVSMDWKVIDFLNSLPAVVDWS